MILRLAVVSFFRPFDAMTSIGDPFVLASYALPKASSSKQKETRRSEHLNVSYSSAGSSKDGYVSVTAQNDGVHVIDVRVLLAHSQDGFSKFLFTTA
jgi:hypothetical protein